MSEPKLDTLTGLLYACLREATVEACHNCPDCDFEQVYPLGKPCTAKPGSCYVQKWRNALAKARGEEAK